MNTNNITTITEGTKKVLENHKAFLIDKAVEEYKVYNEEDYNYFDLEEEGFIEFCIETYLTSKEKEVYFLIEEILNKIAA